MVSNDIFRQETAKNNPAKLETIINTIPRELDIMENSVEEMRLLMKQFNDAAKRVRAILKDNQLINARRVKEYDQNLRLEIVELLSLENLQIIEDQLESVTSAMDELSSYYEDHYKATYDRLGEHIG